MIEWFLRKVKDIIVTFRGHFARLRHIYSAGSAVAVTPVLE